jgi:hypothetical protein
MCGCRLLGFADGTCPVRVPCEPLSQLPPGLLWLDMQREEEHVRWVESLVEYLGEGSMLRTPPTVPGKIVPCC